MLRWWIKLGVATSWLVGVADCEAQFVVTSGHCKAYTHFPGQVPDEYDSGRFQDPTLLDGAYGYDYSYGYGYFYGTSYSAYGLGNTGPINCPAKSGVCCVRGASYPYSQGKAGRLEGLVFHRRGVAAISQRLLRYDSRSKSYL
ncbi:Atrn [Symbiodinium sp. CCMP2592]|nr:Atrn [Symbiodinium sp. CCMP2592]